MSSTGSGRRRPAARWSSSAFSKQSLLLQGCAAWDWVGQDCVDPALLAISSLHERSESSSQVPEKAPSHGAGLSSCA